MLLPYHLRLALRSLRRDPGLSATIVVVLALGAGLFCTAVMHYLRTYVTGPVLPSSLHQVEIAQRHEALEVAFTGSNAEPNVIAARRRVTFANERLLAGLALFWLATLVATLFPALRAARVPPSAASRSL